MSLSSHLTSTVNSEKLSDDKMRDGPNGRNVSSSWNAASAAVLDAIRRETHNIVRIHSYTIIQRYCV